MAQGLWAMCRNHTNFTAFDCEAPGSRAFFMWAVFKIMVPFWVPDIIRHLIFRVPKKGP